MSPDDVASPSLHSYRLIAEIGRGGMANVYLAVVRGQGGFNKLVVVKRTRSDVLIEGDAQAMFLDEARLAARMNHPNVVQTYECGRDAETYFIAMEYLDGQAYSRVLSRLKGRIPLAFHARVIADTLAGLHHAHELCDFDGTPLGVVHRDATPHNVFITYDGSVKVVDFGIAKALDSAAHTSTGVVKGKVAFMSPEQVRGEPLDRRSDVFAVGVMLWEAVAGRRMWGDMPELAVVHELMNDLVPPLNGLPSDTPGALRRILDRALAPRRQDRYARALDMARDLESWLATTGERATARDVGELIAPAFEAERARVREVIETQLKDLRWTGVQTRVVPEDLPSLPVVASGNAVGVPQAPPGAPASASSNNATHSASQTGPRIVPLQVFGPPVAAEPPTGSFVPTESGAAVPMPSRRTGGTASRSLAVPAVVAAVASILVLVLGLRLLRSSPAPAPAASVVPAAPPSSAPAIPSAAAPAAEGVTLTVRGTPADARILLDGMLLSVGSFEGKVLRTAKARTLRIEAKDYTPKEQEVTFTADLVVTYDLAKLEPARTGPAAGKGPAKAGNPHDIDSDSPYRHK